MLQGIAQSGAALSGASAIRINVCGPHPIVVHGTDEQKRRWLVPLIKGEEKACFGVTEPDAGLNTAAIKTRAVWDGEKYMVNGRKMWTTTAQEAKKILLLARTTPREQSKRPLDGITPLYHALDSGHVQLREIAKRGLK